MKKGDRVWRIIEDWDKAPGIVQYVTDTTIVCRVLVDYWRLMEFSRSTLVSTLGAEYGHIELQGEK